MNERNYMMEILGYFLLTAVIMTALLLLGGCGKAGDLLYGDDGDDETIYQNTGDGIQIIGDQNDYSEFAPAPAPTPSAE